MARRHHMNINDKGFSLLELLIAIGILAGGILAIGAMQVGAIKSVNQGDDVTQATTLAENQMELLMRLPYDHPLMEEDPGDLDGAAGLRHPLPPLPAPPIPNLNNPALQPDHRIEQGIYTVCWNIAENDVLNNTKTIDVIVIWSRPGMPTSRNVLLECHKADQ